MIVHYTVELLGPLLLLVEDALVPNDTKGNLVFFTTVSLLFGSTKQLVIIHVVHKCILISMYPLLELIWVLAVKYAAPSDCHFLQMKLRLNQLVYFKTLEWFGERLGDLEMFLMAVFLATFFCCVLYMIVCCMYLSI